MCFSFLFRVPALICKISQDVVIGINTRSDGVIHIDSKPNKVTIENSNRITLASTRLEQGLISPREFIERVKYRLGRGEP